MRIAREALSADADGTVLDNSTLGIRGADCRSFQARIDAALFDTGLGGLAIGVDFAFRTDNRFDSSRSGKTTDKRIASVAASARADGIVTDDLATGIQAASTWAGIATFLRYTGQVVGTVGVGGAFRFTRDVRVAQQAGQTDARVTVPTSGSAFRVCSARIGDASVFAIHRFRRFALDGHRCAGRERIALVAFTTDADRDVIGHFTFGVRSCNSNE